MASDGYSIPDGLNIEDSLCVAMELLEDYLVSSGGPITPEHSRAWFDRQDPEHLYVLMFALVMFGEEYFAS
jgi:hypothetical protein